MRHKKMVELRHRFKLWKGNHIVFGYRQNFCTHNKSCNLVLSMMKICDLQGGRRISYITWASWMEELSSLKKNCDNRFRTTHQPQYNVTVSGVILDRKLFIATLLTFRQSIPRTDSKLQNTVQNWMIIYSFIFFL